MKTIIFAIAIILCGTATAQLTVKGGLGNSFTVNTRVIEVELGAHINGYGIAGGVIAHTNMQADQHAIFNTTFSVVKDISEKSRMNLQVGYAYLLATTDTKDGNYNSLIGKLTYAHTIDEGYQGAHWYVSTAATGGYYTLTVGLMGIFRRD